MPWAGLGVQSPSPPSALQRGGSRRLAADASMPPVANPNPDRARRGAVSTGEAKDEVVPEPLLPDGAPAAAPIVASVAARAVE